MEGVASEAASLGSHLQLGKLIYLYDDNRVTLSAATDLTFSEDRARRFEAYGWHTQRVDDGNDLEAIERALAAARAETRRPSLILVRTHPGYGSPHKHDTFEARGSPLGADEVRLTKRSLGWPEEPPFYIPESAAAHFREASENGERAQKAWNDRLFAYPCTFAELAHAFLAVTMGSLPAGWDADVPVFPVDAKGVATGVASGKVMNAVVPRLSALIGGSADLDASAYTAMHGAGDFEPASPRVSDLQGSAPREGAGATRAATCSSACASMRWARS